MGKKVLVIDGGGRGNAMAHAFSKSEKVGKVYVAPGNAGVHEYGGEALPLQGGTKKEMIPDLIRKAEGIGADLVVPGPEGWLSVGVVDSFHEKTDIPVVGPAKEAAFLETSKCDAKDYLDSIGVPVPEYRNFKDEEKAKKWAEKFYEENPDKDLVPKADGIAAGKGAFVCSSLEETLDSIDKIASKEFNQEYDGAGRRIEVEERLCGQEVSFFVITDGETVKPFGTARDYKRRFSDDDHSFVYKYFGGLNPNTGGMGAYSPQELSEELEGKIMEEVAVPTVRNLEEDYVGVLHFVLMIVEENGEKKPYVLEINVRDGDPETQARLPRLESDIYEIYSSLAAGNLENMEINWKDEYCVGICAVSGRPWKDEKPVTGYAGYPGDYYSKQPIFLTGEKDKRIGEEGISKYVDGFVYHNGTDLHNDFLRSRGGRVITFTNTAETLEKARRKAYEDLEKAFFSFMDYRKDVGI
ncbi:MAG: phosphoribosylamine--glycine ligase [Candidatus Aenigmatarchaeota archaeon]